MCPPLILVLVSKPLSGDQNRKEDYPNNSLLVSWMLTEHLSFYPRSSLQQILTKSTPLRLSQTVEQLAVSLTKTSSTLKGSTLRISPTLYWCSIWTGFLTKQARSQKQWILFSSIISTQNGCFLWSLAWENKTLYSATPGLRTITQRLTGRREKYS